MNTNQSIKDVVLTHRIEISRLRNEEWFQFHTEVRDLINECARSGVAVVGIDTLFDIYNARYAEADIALVLLRKSPTTEKISRAHLARIQCYRGFADVITGFTRHSDSAKRDAALRVQTMISLYGNVARQTYDSATAALYNFAQDVRNGFQGDLALLQVTEWIDQLDEANRTFQSLMQTRYKEKDSQTELRMGSVRAEMDKVYRLMLDQLDINVVAFTDPIRNGTVACIHALNNRIARFRNTLAQRSGRKTAREAVSDDSVADVLPQAA